MGSLETRELSPSGITASAFSDQANFSCFDFNYPWMMAEGTPMLTALTIPTMTEWAIIIFIGLLAGIIIVLGVALVDKLKLDDPVGAVAVHLICGIWGTLAVGIFGSMAGGAQFMTQLYGVLIIGAFCIVTSGIIIGVLKATMGIRVSKEEEIEGLDLHEHGMDAYPDFMND